MEDSVTQIEIKRIFNESTANIIIGVKKEGKQLLISDDVYKTSSYK